MNLYRVSYHTWKSDFSGLIHRQEFSVGTSQEDAISRLKEIVESDARDFSAYPIEEIMGYKITVTE